MATIGSLVVELRANTAKFTQGMGNAARGLKRFSDRTKKLRKSLLNMKTLLLSLAGAAGFSALVLASNITSDSLAKTADKIGVTTQALGGMHQAAKLSGVSTQTMNMALQRMVRRVSEAAKGTGEAQGALRELGIDAQRLAAMAPDQQFTLIAERMKDVATQGDRVRLAMRLFDSEGVSLVNTMALGAKNIKQATDEVIALNAALSRSDSVKIEMASDAMTRVGTVMRGIGNTIAAGLAPFVADLGNRFADAAVKSNGFKDTIVRGMRIATKAVGYLANAIRGLEIAWNVVKLAYQGFVAGMFITLDQLQTSFVRLANIVPGIDIKPIESLAAATRTANAAFAQTKTELVELLAQPMPMDAVMQWFDAVEARTQEHADRVADIKSTMIAAEVNHGKQRVEVESQADKTILNMRMKVGQQIVGLIRSLGNESKTAAIIALGIEKGLAIAQTVINTQVAAMRALAELGPIAGAAAAAKIKALGSLSVGLIAATGLAQAASIGGGSASVGSIANPVYTQPAAQPAITEQDVGGPSGGQVVIKILGNVYGQEDFEQVVVDSVRRAVNDRDEVIIDTSSRQAQEILES